MRQLSRVVWSEGMYLGPQDFQVQSHWFENSIDFASRALWFEPYGLLACEVNREGLLNGTLAVTHARGIFPDGLTFHMGEFDPLPEPRNIKDLFPPTQEHLLAYLAIPSYQPRAQNVGTDHSNGFRYSRCERRAVDENTGLDEKAVAVAAKNIRLVLENELAPSLQCLPIARIRRAGDGKYVADEEFIPICARITASERLMTLGERLIAILSERAEALTSGRGERQRKSQGVSPNEVEAYWFQHALNSTLPVISHLCFTQQGHPEELYRELSRLAGALCTFGMESHPGQIPHYDHKNPEACFNDLDKFIRLHLDLLEPPNRISIPLRNLNTSFHIGDIKDSRCLGRASWFLAVRAHMDEAGLISQAPRSIKVCSARFIAQLVKKAVPGLTLRHVPTPPAALAPRYDTQYFSVTREGPCWDTLVDTKQVGVYVPNELPNPELEFVVLVER